MMTRLIRSLYVVMALGVAVQTAPAWAQTAQEPSAQTSSPQASSPRASSPRASSPQVGEAVPAGFPANLRWNLVPKWIQWITDKAQISWPPNDGCAGAPRARSLAAGEMIDRFGSEFGTFFSPRGESFRSRAVPYVCRQMDYRVYRVVKPIAVKSCKAAPWFDEPGGAVQVQTTEPANKLVADGMIEMVSYAAGGGSGPAPQCGRP